MKTYYDVLAAYPDQAKLRADVDFLLDVQRNPNDQALMDAHWDFSFAAYNESQTHILVNVLSADEDKDADDFFTNLKSMPLDFNTGDDFPDWYFDWKTNRVYHIDDKPFMGVAELKQHAEKLALNLLHPNKTSSTSDLVRLVNKYREKAHLELSASDFATWNRWFSLALQNRCASPDVEVA